MYRIAENVWERKLLRIGGNYYFRGENFHGHSLCHQQTSCTPPNFAEKTFANSHNIWAYLQQIFTWMVQLFSYSVDGN